jgi:hypothetical protein
VIYGWCVEAHGREMWQCMAGKCGGAWLEKIASAWAREELRRRVRERRTIACCLLTKEDKSR